MADALELLMAALGAPLVLVDVGSSGGVPSIWRPLGKHATYVAFEPDARDTRDTSGGDFGRVVYVNKAIAPAEAGDTVRFYLTRSPYCSSTLRPNPKVTESFLSAEKFIVEGETTAPATTLADAIRSQRLSHVDWLKIDTQGTDLKVFRSLPEDMRNGVLAVDLEPGLRGAYSNEELFSDVHGAMIREGMWLSRMEVLGFPRMRKATLDQWASRSPLTEEIITKSVRRTPGWVECRYLRTLESLAERREHVGRREYLALWLFAYADQQYGYCLDIAIEFGRRFPEDPLVKIMSDLPLAQIDAAYARACERSRKLSLVARVNRKVRSLFSGFTRSAAASPVRDSLPSRGHRPELLTPVGRL